MGCKNQYFFPLIQIKCKIKIISVKTVTFTDYKEKEHKILNFIKRKSWKKNQYQYFQPTLKCKRTLRSPKGN